MTLDESIVVIRDLLRAFDLLSKATILDYEAVALAMDEVNGAVRRAREFLEDKP